MLFRSIIAEYERKFKHDIVANIHAFSDLCPSARPFIHLAATSNFINDNLDLIRIKSSLEYFHHRISLLFTSLGVRATDKEIIDLPTIAYTHFQRAQLITMGKRFTSWNQDIYTDLLDLRSILDHRLGFRGVKGAVGSEDALLQLFHGDHDKCDQLNQRLATIYGFDTLFTITTQTYSRKIDVSIFQWMSNLCQSIYKMMNDIRLLASHGEITEYFDQEHQVGSSAMPYKRNPMTCERICSLCRYVINQENTIKQTYMNQWLERTLDDSAIKRILYPDCFMLLEYIVEQSIYIVSSFVIHKDTIHKHVVEHFPNILCEEIIRQGVEFGHDRQKIHQCLRKLMGQGSETSTPSIFSFFVNSMMISSPKNTWKTKEEESVDDSTSSSGNGNSEIEIESWWEDDDDSETKFIIKLIKEKKISIDPKDYIGRCKEQVTLFAKSCV